MLENAMELLRQGDRSALQTIYKETKISKIYEVFP
jgi:hypothetical protein